MSDQIKYEDYKKYITPDPKADKLLFAKDDLNKGKPRTAKTATFDQTQADINKAIENFDASKIELAPEPEKKILNEPPPVFKTFVATDKVKPYEFDMMSRVIDATNKDEAEQNKINDPYVRVTSAITPFDEGFVDNVKLLVDRNKKLLSDYISKDGYENPLEGVNLAKDLIYENGKVGVKTATDLVNSVIGNVMLPISLAEQHPVLKYFAYPITKPFEWLDKGISFVEDINKKVTTALGVEWGKDPEGEKIASDFIHTFTPLILAKYGGRLGGTVWKTLRNKTVIDPEVLKPMREEIASNPEYRNQIIQDYTRAYSEALNSIINKLDVNDFNKSISEQKLLSDKSQVLQNGFVVDENGIVRRVDRPVYNAETKTAIGDEGKSNLTRQDIADIKRESSIDKPELAEIRNLENEKIKLNQEYKNLNDIYDKSQSSDVAKEILNNRKRFNNINGEIEVLKNKASGELTPEELKLKQEYDAWKEAEDIRGQGQLEADLLKGEATKKAEQQKSAFNLQQEIANKKAPAIDERRISGSDIKSEIPETPNEQSNIVDLDKLSDELYKSKADEIKKQGLVENDIADINNELKNLTKERDSYIEQLKGETLSKTQRGLLEKKLNARVKDIEELTLEKAKFEREKSFDIQNKEKTAGLENEPATTEPVEGGTPPPETPTLVGTLADKIKTIADKIMNDEHLSAEEIDLQTRYPKELDAKLVELRTEKPPLLSRIGNKIRGLKTISDLEENIGKPIKDMVGFQLRQAWRKTFNPRNYDYYSREVGGILTKKLAELSRDTEIAKYSLSEIRKYYDKINKKNPQAGIDDLKKYEAGLLDKNDSAFKFFQTMEGLLQDKWKLVQDKTGIKTFLENYVPHIYKDPVKAGRIMHKILSRKPVQGAKTFTHKRLLETIMEAEKQGLELITNNPADLFLMKMYELDKFLMARNMWEEFKSKRLIKFTKHDIPEGYAPIDDNIAKVFSKGQRLMLKDFVDPEVYEQLKALNKQNPDKVSLTIPNTDIVHRGQWVMPEYGAKIINNYLSSGLYGKHTWYDLARLWGNALNQAQLGLSGFHFIFTTNDAIISSVSNALEKVLRPKTALGETTKLGNYISDFKSAGSSLMRVPIFWKNIVEGSKLRKLYLEKQTGRSGTPLSADYMKQIEFRLAQAVERAGGRIRMDNMYYNDMISKFKKNWNAPNSIGKYGMLAVRLPFATMEMIAKPLMEVVVPRQKLGVFSMMAEDLLNLEAQGRLTKAQTTARLQEAWRSVENRMGQLAYDNLFWNRTVKDLGILSVRSLGWNLGTFRELGGGLLDIKKSITEGRVTPRLAYTTSLLMGMGLVNAVITYTATGKPPSELADYFYPKTGGKNPDGTDARMSIPSYMKDVYAYLKDISEHNINIFGYKTIHHKLHPLFSSGIDLINNKDFFDYAISDKEGFGKLGDYSLYILKQFLPFSIQNIIKKSETEGYSWGNILKGAMGFTPAPRYVENTDLENNIYERYDKRFGGVKPLSDKEKQDLKKEIKKNYLAGEMEKVQDLYYGGIARGLLPDEDIKKYMDNLQLPTPIKLFKQLPKVDQEELLQGMNEEEKKVYYPWVSGLREQPSAEGRLLYNMTTTLQKELSKEKDPDRRQKLWNAIYDNKYKLYQLKAGELQPQNIRNEINTKYDFNDELKRIASKITTSINNKDETSLQEAKNELKELETFNLDNDQRHKLFIIESNIERKKFIQGEKQLRMEDKNTDDFLNNFINNLTLDEGEIK